MKENFSLVKFSNEKNQISSLDIAEITGKRHSNVLRDIRNLLDQGVNQLNFELVEYTDNKGESHPCYKLTKKGCLILASGYDALLREKIIDRLAYLEDLFFQKLKEENKRLEEENKRLQNPFPVCDKSITMQIFANFLTTYTGEKIGRTKLFEICRKLGYIQQGSKTPYQKYIESGDFEVIFKKRNLQTLVTPKGQDIISDKILPLIVKLPSYPLF